MKRIIKVILMVSIFVVGVVLGYINNLSTEDNIISQSTEENHMVMYPVLELRVYDENGNLVKTYTKVGDPPTYNFLKWLYHSTWYTTDYATINNRTWTTTDGTSGIPSSDYMHGGDGNYVLKVVLGNGTTPPSPSDYALENQIAGSPVIYYNFESNETHMWIEYRGIYTATDYCNITEIGLIGYMNGAIGTIDRWLLLFRDVVPTISLEPDQSIEVWYRIYVQYAD